MIFLVWLLLLAGVPAFAAEEEFSVEMPIRLEDTARSAYGLAPFGAHIGDHGRDGHPGWDVEYRPGALALAAADGVVQTVYRDPKPPHPITVQLQHARGRRNYRTVYNGLGSVRAEITPGRPVRSGQPLGVPQIQNRTIGRQPVTYASIHFQVDDFSADTGALSNINAVSPEKFLSAKGRAVFEPIWNQAAYFQELCEPFPTNPRNVEFPLRRSWTLRTGLSAARIEFAQPSRERNDLRYRFFDREGQVISSGQARLDPAARPFSTIELQPEGGGGLRRGIYDVVGSRLRIDFGLEGGIAPKTLARGSLYETQP